MLTLLQEKLAEAHGLAIGAAAVTARLQALEPERALLPALERMHRDADETRARCLAVEAAFGVELAEELLSHTNVVANQAADLLGAWFKAGTDPISGWAFLAMGEAAEVAVWTAVDVLSEGGEIAELAGWALPVQEEHLRVALEGAETVARAQRAPAANAPTMAP